jgi:hypothetical protein
MPKLKGSIDFFFQFRRGTFVGLGPTPVTILYKPNFLGKQHKTFASRVGHYWPLQTTDENDYIWGRAMALVGVNGEWWLGGTNAGHTGKWVWIVEEGEVSMTYTSWHPNEPNNTGHENYVHVGKWSAHWNSRDGSAQLYFVCKYHKTLP